MWVCADCGLSTARLLGSGSSMDVLSSEQRSTLMRSIRSKDSALELDSDVESCVASVREALASREDR